MPAHNRVDECVLCGGGVLEFDPILDGTQIVA